MPAVSPIRNVSLQWTGSWLHKDTKTKRRGGANVRSDVGRAWGKKNPLRAQVWAVDFCSDQGGGGEGVSDLCVPHRRTGFSL